MVCFPALDYIRGIYVVGKRKSNAPTLCSNVFLISVFFTGECEISCKMLEKIIKS